MTQVITKEKGDTGLIQVIANLDKSRIKCALPLSEHLPFDLIAINEHGKLSKVSVKYKSAVNGTVSIPLRSISTNMKGWKAKTVNFDDIDAFAVYCPDNNECYYVGVEKLRNLKNTFSLRVKSSTRPSSTVNFALDFKNPAVLFE